MWAGEDGRAGPAGGRAGPAGGRAAPARRGTDPLSGRVRAGPVCCLVLTCLLLGPTGAAIAAGALVAGAGGMIVLTRRLGGLTGDVLGAGVELSELTWLILGASCAHRNVL